MKDVSKLALSAVTFMATVFIYALGLLPALRMLVFPAAECPTFRSCVGIVLAVHLLVGRPEAGGAGYWQELKLSLLQAAARAFVAAVVTCAIYFLI